MEKIPESVGVFLLSVGNIVFLHVKRIFLLLTCLLDLFSSMLVYWFEFFFSFCIFLANFSIIYVSPFLWRSENSAELESIITNWDLIIGILHFQISFRHENRHMIDRKNELNSTLLNVKTSIKSTHKKKNKQKTERILQSQANSCEPAVAFYRTIHFKTSAKFA